MFPVINNINDVLPFIKDDKSFVVIDKGDYTVIDYVIEQSDTFPKLSSGKEAAIRRECRGIAFDKDGNIVRRGLQKFFNVGQNEESLVENINWEKPHLVMDKMDGSLIFNINLDGENILGTRKGVTDVSVMADRFVINSPHIMYQRFINYMSVIGYTVFFEFFSQENMIVIDYGSPHMTLIGARKMKTGEYLSHQSLVDIAKDYNVPVVDIFEVDTSDPSLFLEHAKSEKDKEGYVIRFDDGYSVKVKGDWYVQLHHTISGLNTNRNIARLLIDNSIDDILPILPDRRRESVMSFASEFWKFYSEFCDKIMKSWLDVKSSSSPDWSRKDWAMRIKKEDPYYMGLMFKFLDSEGDLDFTKAIKDFVMSKMNKESVFDEFCKYAGFDF